MCRHIYLGTLEIRAERFLRVPDKKLAHVYSPPSFQNRMLL